MKINENTWHYKIIAKDKLAYIDENLMPKDLCSYCWSLIWALIWRIFIFIVFSIFSFIMLNVFVADWLYGWYALIQYGEAMGLWENQPSVFYIANCLIIVLPCMIGFMKFTSSNLVSQRIEDLKEGRCSLIEYEEDE